MPTIPATNKASIASLRNSQRGRTLVIQATGPSLNEIEGLERIVALAGVDVLSINRPHPGLSPTHLHWQDTSVFVRNKADILSRPTLNICGFRACPGDTPNTIFVPIINARGWSRDLSNGMYSGKSSTYTALQIGFHCGYARIYILGCDMGGVGGKTWHYEGSNPDITEAQRIPRFELEAQHWDFAAKALRPEERERVYFCSDYNRFKFVDAFQRLSHRGVVGRIASATGASARLG